jgi:hypothetical protein
LLTEQEEVIRGHAAEDLLNNKLYKESISAVREGIIRGIELSAMGDSDTHNRFAIALQLLNSIEKQLKTHVETGKLAQIQVRDGVGTKLRMAAGF